MELIAFGFFVYIAVGYKVTDAVWKKYGWQVGICLFIIFVYAPVWDMIPLKIYFDQLCASQGEEERVSRVVKDVQGFQLTETDSHFDYCWDYASRYGYAYCEVQVAEETDGGAGNHNSDRERGAAKTVEKPGMYRLYVRKRASEACQGRRNGVMDPAIAVFPKKKRDGSTDDALCLIREKVGQFISRYQYIRQREEIDPYYRIVRTKTVVVDKETGEEIARSVVMTEPLHFLARQFQTHTSKSVCPTTGKKGANLVSRVLRPAGNKP
ncbi:MAG: hypothetical protein HQL52_00480 [Magnetococcales bacterium]|nr:hypothetical protein [Magnetococcales bacterium]